MLCPNAIYIEQKTKKPKTIALNKAIVRALTLYAATAAVKEKPIIENICTGKAISRMQAYRIIRAACEALEFKYRVSCHSRIPWRFTRRQRQSLYRYEFLWKYVADKPLCTIPLAQHYITYILQSQAKFSKIFTIVYMCILAIFSIDAITCSIYANHSLYETLI